MYINEEAIIASACRGDVDAFNRLVMAYQQQAFNLAYRILGDQERAADATQEAFLRGFRALAQYRGGAFKVWMLRIVTNCCYDQLRAMQRRPSTPLDDLMEDGEHSKIVEDPGETPEARVERRELGLAIQVGLNALPPDQRVVVVMSDIEGMSYEEIAQATAVSLGTVKSRLSRGRARMRDYLLAHRELFPDRSRLRANTDTHEV